MSQMKNQTARTVKDYTATFVILGIITILIVASFI